MNFNTVIDTAALQVEISQLQLVIRQISTIAGLMSMDDPEGDVSTIAAIAHMSADRLEYLGDLLDQGSDASRGGAAND